MAEYGHGQGVTDQNDVDGSLVNQTRTWIVIGGQAGDGLMLKFLLAKGSDSNLMARFDNRCNAHDVLQCPSALADRARTHLGCCWGYCRPGSGGSSMVIKRYSRRNRSVFDNPVSNQLQNLRGLRIPKRGVRHVGIDLKTFVRRSRKPIKSHALPVAHHPILAAFDQQRRRMQARRDLPPPAKDDALHIEQIPEADVLVSQRVHAAAGNELRVARTFFKTFATRLITGSR